MMIKLIREKTPENIEISGNKNTLTTFLNPFSYLKLRKHEDLLKQMDVILIDGILLVTALRLLGVKRCQRYSFDMTSVAKVVLPQLEEQQETVYFVGSTQENIDKFEQQMRLHYPQMKIVGTHSGFFKDQNHRNDILDSISEQSPNTVVVGMGAIHQERFLKDLKEKGWKGTGYTCGGFIHQTHDAIQYYPKWVDRFHLRWMYRMFDEPKLIKRYLIIYPWAMTVISFDAIFRRR